MRDIITRDLNPKNGTQWALATGDVTVMVCGYCLDQNKLTCPYSQVFVLMSGFPQETNSCSQFNLKFSPITIGISRGLC